MPPLEPKPVHAMTDGERRAMLHRREVVAGAGMEIGGHPGARRAVRVGGRVLVLLAVGTLFVVLLFKFTASWRVAVLVVTLMLAYMITIGRLVEGRADRTD